MKLKFGKKKKADLSLSVNSIVILIIAITVLGLGLTFVRGLFSKATSKVTQAIDLGDLTEPPTSDDPLKVTPKELELRTGKSNTIVVNFMNALGSTKYCKFIKPDVTPNPKDTCKFPPSITLNTNCYRYNKDQIYQFKLGVEGRSEVMRSDYNQCSEKNGMKNWGTSPIASQDADEGTWVLTLKMVCFDDSQTAETTCKNFKPESSSQSNYAMATKDLVVKITQ